MSRINLHAYIGKVYDYSVRITLDISVELDASSKTTLKQFNKTKLANVYNRCSCSTV